MVKTRSCYRFVQCRVYGTSKLFVACAHVHMCMHVLVSAYALAPNLSVLIGSHSSMFMIYLQVDGVLCTIWWVLSYVI